MAGTLYDVNETQLKDIREAYTGILEIMSKFIDSVDQYTEDHSARVAECAVATARAVDLGEEKIEEIRVGACLHDIGKVEVRTKILR